MPEFAKFANLTPALMSKLIEFFVTCICVAGDAEQLRTNSWQRIHDPIHGFGFSVLSR